MNLEYIFNGKMGCSCGYEAHIEEGVLLTPNKNTSLHDKPDVDREMYKDLPPSLISLFQRSYNWMQKRLEAAPIGSQVVMESYVNAWFFMHNHLDCLSTQGKYIIVDKYPETLAMYKGIIEQQRTDLDILYIADSTMDLPLKKHCIDLHIDFFAANEHNFYRHTFLYEEMMPYFHEKSKVLGTYFYFENAPRSMGVLLDTYPECYERNFSKEYFLEYMEKVHMKINAREICGYTTDSGENLGFGFHMAGEKMFLMPFEAAIKKLTDTQISA